MSVGVLGGRLAMRGDRSPTQGGASACLDAPTLRDATTAAPPRHAWPAVGARALLASLGTTRAVRNSAPLRPIQLPSPPTPQPRSAASPSAACQPSARLLRSRDCAACTAAAAAADASAVMSARTSASKSALLKGESERPQPRCWGWPVCAAAVTDGDAAGTPQCCRTAPKGPWSAGLAPPWLRQAAAPAAALLGGSKAPPLALTLGVCPALLTARLEPRLAAAARPGVLDAPTALTPRLSRDCCASCAPAAAWPPGAVAAPDAEEARLWSSRCAALRVSQPTPAASSGTG